MHSTMMIGYRRGVNGNKIVTLMEAGEYTLL